MHVIDLNFKGLKDAAAAFLIETDEGPVLIESGPLATLPTLQQGILDAGVDPEEIKKVFLTHIHLDHAGAAGWFASNGADIFVHPKGAPHLIDPSKLNASATRIYGDHLTALLGEMLPSPEDKVHAIHDGETVQNGVFEFTPIETPGHAGHHHVWATDIDGERVCFTGDVAGMRIPGSDAITLPLAPPELDPALWHQSIDQIEASDFDSLILTHSARVDLVNHHLDRVREQLDIELQLLQSLAEDESLNDEERKEAYLEALHNDALRHGASADLTTAHLTKDHAEMNLMGIQRLLRR